MCHIPHWGIIKPTTRSISKYVIQICAGRYFSLKPLFIFFHFFMFYKTGDGGSAHHFRFLPNRFHGKHLLSFAPFFVLHDNPSCDCKYTNKKTIPVFPLYINT